MDLNQILASKASLQLVKGQPSKLTFGAILHFLYVFLPHLSLTLPFSIFYNHFIKRWTSQGIVNATGRPALSDIVVTLTRYYLGRTSPAQGRILMNRTTAYSHVVASPFFAGYRDWVSYVNVNGVTGRWYAPPGTKRSEDEVVLYYVHGGGFVLDTAGNAQLWALALLKEMNLTKKIQFSIFFLDYELAPEFKYPSQLIEVQSGYQHLVNDLGISHAKICLSGDSAGGNLAAAYLLHLARPNPAIPVNTALGPVPTRPGSVFLISPFIKLVSHLPSRTANGPYDYIETRSSFSAALDYIGVPHPSKTTFLPSYNPLHLVYSPYPPVPTGLISGAKYVKDGKGLDLFNSPYVNPSVCEDLEWWREALPGAGRTCVTWGGKEIFRDEIVQFVDILDRAGIETKRLCKSKGAHDWILYDYVVPGVWRTNSLLEDREFSYGMKNVSTFLQQVDLDVRATHHAIVRAAAKISVPVAVVPAKEVEEEELAESVVVVAQEEEAEVKEDVVTEPEVRFRQKKGKK